MCCIDEAKEVFEETFSQYEAKLTKNNNYFYNMKKLSFGFSPTKHINLGNADTKEGHLRLSWHNSGSTGGYRVG